jgi:hypothetical protein
LPLHGTAMGHDRSHVAIGSHTGAPPTAKNIWRTLRTSSRPVRSISRSTRWSDGPRRVADSSPLNLPTVSRLIEGWVTIVANLRRSEPARILRPMATD